MILSTDTINPNEYYAATTIIRRKWFPWIKSQMTFMGMIKTKKAQLMYEPIIRQAGKQTRYYISGKKILEIKKLAEEGKLII
jgi:hypothetical protein